MRQERSINKDTMFRQVMSLPSRNCEGTSRPLSEHTREAATCSEPAQLEGKQSELVSPRYRIRAQHFKVRDIVLQILFSDHLEP